MTLTTIKKPKKQKRWLFPEAIEREYVKYLQAIAKQISDTARKKLLEITPHLKKTLRQDDSIEILEQWLTELLQATTFYTRDNDIRPVVRQFLSQTAEFNKKQFHKVLKSAYKVDIFVSEPWLDEPLLQAEWQNINLIKSLPMQLQEKLRYRMAEAVLGGESYKSLAADLEKLLDIPKRRATIIARDQIGKLNGRLTQLRQENIGVKSYIWRGSLDERERLLHVEREGKEFRWDNPPEDGHPGQPILCRCSAEAVLPEFGELNGVIATDPPVSFLEPEEENKPPMAGVRIGRPMSFEEANSGNVNPNYNKNEGYRINCQTCVPVFEARLRGYNVQALPNIKGSMSEKLSHQTNLIWIDPKTGEHPHYIFDHYAKTAKKYVEFIDSVVKQGERYSIEFFYKNRGNLGGHIMNLDRTKEGLLRLKENQAISGRTEWLGDEIIEYFKQANVIFHDPKADKAINIALKIMPDYDIGKQTPVPKLLRIDNMEFDFSVADQIMEAKK
ncbi:phage minor head protein [Gallibacterium anatis]|uniref:phage minor head protein n=1 Tax=Gallibacterium anatis TaxID=750 RepID=UPI0009B86D5E|nr:phage minor head protein [Gallibacterium anatis]